MDNQPSRPKSIRYSQREIKRCVSPLWCRIANSPTHTQLHILLQKKGELILPRRRGVSSHPSNQVKCDRSFPCSRCVSRGLGELCTRE